MTNTDLLKTIDDFAGTGNTEDRERLDVLEKAHGKIHGMLITARMKKLMMDFGERDTDIYVTTYQKSGTTLVQMLLYQMTTDGSMDFEHLYDVSPWCRYAAFTNGKMADAGERRIIKTHDEYEVLHGIKKGKFVFVIRDCLDVISSLHEHVKDYGSPQVDFNDLAGRNMKRWFDYNRTWLRNESDLPIMYVHYEDLLSDKRKVIMELAAFLEIPLNEEIITRCLERTSFAFMKQYEAKFGEQPEQGKVYNNFIRKGVVGEGKVKFTAEQLEQYSALFGECGSGDDHILRYAK